MPNTNISSTQTGIMSTTQTNYSVDPKTLDSTAGQTEYKWMCTRAGDYLGYYKTTPELKIAIDTKVNWTVGKGYESSPLTDLAFSMIRGCGKDTLNSILRSLVRNYNIYGDAYAEIVRLPDDSKKLVNIKVLDPSKISIVQDDKGMIIRYEQIIRGKPKEFTTDQILHIPRNRMSDECHGTGIIDACEWIILARNEAMADYKLMLHRNVYPVRIWHLDTDVPSEISAFKSKVAAAKGNCEDIFIPKGCVETELASVPSGSVLDPKAWIQLLTQAFYQATGVPQIAIGGSQELTQTAAQIAYLAFEQTIEEEQLYIEEQILNQLNLEIELSFPASLKNNLLSDEAKDGTTDQQMNQPSNFSPPMMRTGVVQ